VGNYGAVESDSELSLYIAEYHFVGQVTSGPDPFIVSPDGTGCRVEPVELTPELRIGLSSSRVWGQPIPEEFKASEIVTVLCEVQIPEPKAYA
jgi:hypothetical protein